MATRATPAEFAAAARRAAHPPVREGRFWIIQAMVLLIAGVHLLADLHVSTETGAFPAGIPVALLILPVGYAALRYGLTGSAATGIWATLAWLPDLLLPYDQGHVGADLVNLALVDAVAFFFGQHIEAERLAHARVERATAERLAAEARYRQLFETNRSPILVLDDHGRVSDANPAARALLGADVAGRSSEELFGGDATLDEQAGRVLCLPDGRDYRLGLVTLPAGTSDPSTQVIFEDVTEERSEGRRATRYAELVVEAEEDQRRRLSRELHDEPLQLFLHLARRLESLGGTPGLPGTVAGSLREASRQALDAAARLRTLARDLRPPALDELGLVAALSSLLTDVEDEARLDVTFKVTGTETRLAPEIELGVFRIVQEAVRNTLRHAGASHLLVTVGFQTDDLALSVSDDGRGFVPEHLGEQGAGHLGLLGMHERTRLLGGHLEVRSAPGQGTVIEATVPLSTPRPERGAVSPDPGYGGPLPAREARYRR
ncbi:MAG TPA: ATP-binding protein [Streptosporangiaceae bacterium]|nr:ATP-binding protein [Streptosporangiaceae bacterium]